MEGIPKRWSRVNRKTEKHLLDKPFVPGGEKNDTYY